MSEVRQPKWYDSIWLGKYFAARDILRRDAPDRLAAFEEAMQVFRCPPDFSVKVIRELLVGSQLAEIRDVLRSIPKDRLEIQELEQFGRFIVHGWPAIDTIHRAFVDRVSQWTGEAVEPSYNFLSLYTHRGICEPHLDAPSAKWTLDICIDQSAPWPIHFSRIVDWPQSDLELGEDWRERIKSDQDLHFRSETLLPGDALLFTGPNQWHYRDPYAQAGGKPHCDLLFFHFVPKGTSSLVDPGNWADIFEVPQLGVIGSEPIFRRFIPG